MSRYDDNNFFFHFILVFIHITFCGKPSMNETTDMGRFSTNIRMKL